MFIIDEEVLKKCSRAYRIPITQLRERTEKLIRNNPWLVFQDAVEQVVESFEEERKERVKVNVKERRSIPDISTYLDSLSKLLEDFCSGTDPSSIASLFDADWDGMGSQTVLNKFLNITSQSIPSHFITYHKLEPALEFIRNKKPRKVILLDYEPHNEIEEILQNVEEVLIFGKHVRPDMRKLSQRDRRIKYINTRDYDVGDRPITFLMWNIVGHLADQYLEYIGGRKRFYQSVAIPAILGNYGYGWAPLAKYIAKMSDVPYVSKKLKRITGKLMRLVAFNHNNAKKIVDALTIADSFEHELIKRLMKLYRAQSIDRKYEESLTYAIENYRVIGDVVVFPITGWETTKPFTFKLRLIAKELQKNLAIIIDCNDPVIRKMSIRTAYFDDTRIDISELLDTAYSSLPPDIERNYGAHESVGGAVCKKDDLPLVLKQVVATYFKKTGWEEEIAKYDSIFEEFWNKA